MKMETVELHGLDLVSAMEKAEKNLNWCLTHGVEVIVFNHGKGHHSANGLSVIKQELRRRLKGHPLVEEYGYRVLYGENDLPLTLTFNEGQTLVAAPGCADEYIGGRSQQEKNRLIYSEEGRRVRKQAKRDHARKRK